MPNCRARVGARAVALVLASGALGASTARADDPAPAPPDPPAVTLPAAPDPTPDPSPQKPATAEPARSAHRRSLPSTPPLRAAQLPRPHAASQRTTSLTSSTPQPQHKSAPARHTSRIPRRTAVSRRPAVPAPRRLARPAHERLAAGPIEPLAARSAGSAGGDATTPMLLATAALLLGVLGLFVLRMLSPQLVAAGQLPRRSRQRPARSRQRPLPPRAPGRRVEHRDLDQPPAKAAASPARAKAARDKAHRTVAAEKAAYRRQSPTQHVSAPKQRQALALTCEIRLFRGYVKSQFYAEVTPAEGRTSYAAAASDWFRWRRADRPTPEPAVVEARDRLLDTLAADGWVRVGQGAEWFSDRLERRAVTP